MLAGILSRVSLAERTVLRIAVFAAGALLMALEVAAFRIIGKTFGSALRETTTVIAVFLAAMSIGYWAGGRAGDRWPRASTLVLTLLIAAASMLFVPQIDAALSPRIAASDLALATHAFLASAILFAIPTVLLAATSPIAVRLFTTSSGHSGSTAGSISAISTIGSIAGSIVTAFMLIDWLGSIMRTVTFVATATCATALAVVLVARRNEMQRRAVLAGLAAVLLIFAGSMFRSSWLEAAPPDEHTSGRVVYAGDSPYHRILVRDNGPYRYLQFDVGRQTRMKRSDPYGAGLDYTDAFHIAPLFRPQIRRVLLIGLGGGTAAKQFSRLYPGAHVDVAEIDPKVVEVAQRFFAVEPGERLRIHVQDGRTFLARTDERWDLIVIDAYTTNRYGDTIPAHLTSREFFDLVGSRLTEGGIAHFHSAFTAPRFFNALLATMAASFDSVVYTDGEVLASNVPLIADQNTLLARARQSPAAHLPSLASAIRAIRTDLPSRNTVILTDDYAPVDTLLRGR